MNLKEYIQNTVKMTSQIAILEFGIDSLRLDAIIIDCYKRTIRGFEYKQTRQDFLNDTKWEQYLKYCNTFTFVCPAGLINRNEISKGIGLLYLNNGYSYLWIKRPHNKPVDKEIYIKMISLMLNKAKFRKNDIL